MNLKKIIICGILLSFTVAAFAVDHPYFQLKKALNNIGNNFNSIEVLETELDGIKPAACQVDNISISHEEMTFLLTLFKLDFAVTLISTLPHP